MKSKHRNRFGELPSWPTVACAAATALLALWSGGCSRCSDHQTTAAPAPARSAEPTATVPSPSPAVPTPITPSVPLQLLACGDREFFRITSRALEVFEIAPEIPAPQIRGSRVARQSTEVAISEPSNVLRLADGTILALAKSEVLHYELGRKENPRYPPIPLHGALVAWAASGEPRMFRVHAGGEAALHEYELGPFGGGQQTPATALRILEARVEPLPEFDSRWLAVMTDGAPLYSSAHGLMRAGKEPSGARRPIPPATVLVFADPSPENYWLATGTGGLERWGLDGAAPTVAARVPGVAMETAVEGTRLVVLSLQLVGESYRPAITMFDRGRQVRQIEVAPSEASLGQPKLDLCLISGRPWVVVGSTQWLQLLDLDGPRLLAEW